MSRCELTLLFVLANHLRFVALSQIARIWFGGQRHARRQASRLAKKLADAGWLRITEVLARPIRPLRFPLFNWQHAEPAPDFAELSQRLHERANQSAAITTVVSATAKTNALLCSGRSGTARIKLTQTTHDLHVAEVFLRYASRGLAPGIQWVSEDALPLTWPVPQRPDALLITDGGTFLRALEYGGDYSAQRLAELHDALASIPVPYEIW